MIFSGWVEAWGGGQSHSLDDTRQRESVRCGEELKEEVGLLECGVFWFFFLKGCLFADGRQFLRAEPVNTPAEL